MINFVKTIRKNLQSPTDPEKTYALAQMRECLTLSDLAGHMASHNSKYNKGDIMAVLTQVCDCVKEQLLNGNKVELGDLGSFWLSLKSTGVLESVVDRETGEKPVFSAAHITGINVKWSKGTCFKTSSMMQAASFCEVETRAALSAALKLKKEQLAAGTYDPSGKKGTTGDENHD